MRWLPAVLLYPALIFAADPPTIAIDPQPPAANAPFLGVSLDEVDDALNYHLKLDNDLGILVTEVMPGSPAENMGLKIWDVIVAADDQQVYTPRSFQNLIAGKKVGDPVSITVRRGTEEATLNGTIAPRPAEAMRPRGPGGFPDPRDQIQEMQRRMREQMRGHLRHAPQGDQSPLPMPDQRSGTITQPDGSVLQWSIQEERNGESM